MVRSPDQVVRSIRSGCPALHDASMDHDMNSDNIKLFDVSELAFDEANPRLAEFDTGGGEPEIIKMLWEMMDVEELVLSIAASGYFRHEPVIVTREGGGNVVIEGNRRLAAVKLLRQPALGRDFNARIPTISHERKESLARIPGLLKTREDAWRYLGFKHVNGPAKWGSYAKSQYIADVHRNFGVPLDEIANQIGDTHNTVRRLYRGLMVIEQAERLDAFSRDDRWRGHFAFSHLYTGLPYPGISEFLDLQSANEETQEPVPAERKDNLRELLVWMYGSKSEKKPPVIQSQNPHLRWLDDVLANREALAALRQGAELSSAFEISRPSSNLFEEALVAAKQHLEKARGILSTGYDGSKELLRIAAATADLAYDLHEEMERKSLPKRSRRKSTE